MECVSNKKSPKPCWNEMEELKYLICAIDCCKCPELPPEPSCSIILPPRIQELPTVMPPQRPPCCPPPPCQPPIAPGPCCPCPLPAPPQPEYRPPLPLKQPCCPPCCPLPCYPNSYC